MNNFTFQNPVKILFGKGQISALCNEIPKNKRILITYGSGSIKKNGVYDQVVAALKNRTLFEFGGIEPNPQYATLMKAVALIKKEKIDFILSVGGGSIIDGTKFIAAAVYFEGEPWDILEKKLPVTKAMPLATVLTLPATGSEMNCGSVVSKDHEKLLADHEVVTALETKEMYILTPNLKVKGLEYEKSYPDAVKAKNNDKNFLSKYARKLSQEELVNLIKEVEVSI